MTAWKIWVDTGGTFTDSLAVDPEGNLHRLKVLSSSLLRGYVVRQHSPGSIEVSLPWPVHADIYERYRLTLGTSTCRVLSVDTKTGIITVDRLRGKVRPGTLVELQTNEEAPVFAARLLTQTKVGEPFPEIDMNLGSTRGTNAILERKGANTAFIVTKGFRDLLVIGNQQRPDLFALHVEKAPLYYTEVIEADERIDSSGVVLRPLSKSTVSSIIRQLKKTKSESVAIAFLNAYKNPSHELLLKETLEKSGYKYVSASSSLSRQIKILDRAETTVANAYLAPVIHSYISNIRKGLQRAHLRVMASYGGLLESTQFQPKDSLLSGPAGGVAGAAMKANESGIRKIIAFDMGGTSTDVSLYDGRFDYRFESRVGSLKILSPSLSIETIAAGGGSICNAGDESFSVGPESAGAQPGPACYGRGGPLTITDVNLLLGRLDPDRFAIPLSVKAAQKAFDAFCRKGHIGNSSKQRLLALLSLVRIANEKMAGAIRRVSTQVGRQPSDYTLLAFGGAGGQHACALADILSMSSILIPYDAGLLSAYGIGNAKVQRFRERLMLLNLADALPALPNAFVEMEQAVVNELVHEGHSRSIIRISDRLAFLRFKGQETSLEIRLPETAIDFNALKELFRERYVKIFGHWLPDRIIEMESLRISAEAAGHTEQHRQIDIRRYKPKASRTRLLTTPGGTLTCPVHVWEELHAGAVIQGPALVISNNSSTFVDKDWAFNLDVHNNALLTRRARKSNKSETHSAAASLELFANRFTFVAQEMGVMLQRTSFSVNVKERLDFSCAVLDKNGYLVVNAPHIPVHLGSLGICVREVIKKQKMEEGDVIITNHPAFGGSHLPDVTLIKSVFREGELVGYVANRAHHAEIGGTRPGSMPPDATTLEEEGVIIEPTYLVKQGQARWAEIEQLFTGAKYPTRLWKENRADLNGALASANLGEQLLQELCDRYDIREVIAYMLKLRRHAAESLRSAMKKFATKAMAATEMLDDGSPLRVSIRKSAELLTIDFTGSSPVHRGNLNATRAIVQSVVLYVLRVLVDRPIPMNEGLLDPVRVIVPEGLLSPDFTGPVLPAVVGGNTEVSQRLTDTLLKALGLAACSQGTMNNFLFGNDSLGYYETICGGTGAGEGYDGTSAVHHHMTNTRITDPEIMELRYPVRLERFEVRRGSGGQGRWRGGDGVIREVTFLEKLEVSILSQHRKERPYGLHGGDDGQVGRQWIVAANGRVMRLSGIDSASLRPGDKLVIETPGGGGYGRPTRKRRRA
jgi:5-oxoprolinase (ATP-hydrolysing)